MSANSSIEWTEKTWNPVRGCSIVSPGCHHCYAMKQAHRFSGPGRAYEGLTKQTKAGPQWTGVVRTVKDALLEPLSWRKPQRVFVNSMSDLFHEDVPDAFIDQVFAVMALAQQHTFQILTKRPARMREYVTSRGGSHRGVQIAAILMNVVSDKRTPQISWPSPNVWLGVSVEDQQRADERIPLLLQTPAAVRFISAEPLLGPVSIRLSGGVPLKDGTRWSGTLPVLDWVIVGGESGPAARPFEPAWARAIVRECRAVNVPVFVKQLGAHIITRNDDGWEGDTPRSWPMDTDYEEDLHGFRDAYQGAPVRVRLTSRKGGDMAEWPEDLRVRQFPEVRS